MNALLPRQFKALLELLRTEIDLPPISQPLITGVSRFWFSFEINSQPPSRLCGCGKCLASTTLSGRIDSPFLLLSYGSLPH
jgi:hypothetical protein